VHDPWAICRMQLPEYHVESGDQVRLAVEKGSISQYDRPRISSTQVQADWWENPGRASGTRRLLAWRTKTSSDFQGVAAGDRCSGPGSVGFAVCLTSPRTATCQHACACARRKGAQDQVEGRVTCLPPNTACVIDGREHWEVRDRVARRMS
jgi:hypothetical protein